MDKYGLRIPKSQLVKESLLRIILELVYKGAVFLFFVSHQPPVSWATLEKKLFFLLTGGMSFLASRKISRDFGEGRDS